MKLSGMITNILLVFAVGVSYLIWGTDLLTLTSNEKLSNTIQLWACTGALISAGYVILSYVTTNEAFVASQKPILSIAAGTFPQTIVRDRESNEEVHATQINYSNPSNNAFYDLNISLMVESGPHQADLSDLFKSNMYLGPHDTRQRNFITKDILLKKNFNIDRFSSEGKEIHMELGFSYTFLGKLESVSVQGYIWSPNRQVWDIET